MEERFNLRYKKLLEILPDVAECADKKLILAGGTALALFHLQHRISIDLDFIPLKGNDITAKEELKGCLTKKGYVTQRAAHTNQFVVQFEDTGIKIEVFLPKSPIKCSETKTFGNRELLVASIEDILKLKKRSYRDRQEARDLFDILAILKKKGHELTLVVEMIRKHGHPKNMDDIDSMVPDKDKIALFKKVVEDASKTSS